MASKFEIQVKKTTKATRVRMVDEDQGETTEWARLLEPFGEAPNDVMVAAAFLHSQEFSDMTHTAQNVAYAVYLGEDNFDIHQVNDQWAQEKISGWLRQCLQQKREDEEPRMYPKRAM